MNRMDQAMNTDARKTRPAQAVRLSSAVVLAMLVAGCGILGRDRPVYVASAELEPLRVPSDLSQPRVANLFEIPGYSLPELAARGNEAMPPRVLSSADAESARSRIRFGPTGLYLEVDDEAASVWRRLGFALNRGEMSVQQVLLDQRRYQVRFIHEPILVSQRGWFSRMFLFWRSPEFIDYSGTYMLDVQRATPASTRVVILGENGEVLPMQQAEFVLGRLQDRLG